MYSIGKKGLITQIKDGKRSRGKKCGEAAVAGEDDGSGGELEKASSSPRFIVENNT